VTLITPIQYRCNFVCSDSGVTLHCHFHRVPEHGFHPRRHPETASVFRASTKDILCVLVSDAPIGYPPDDR
jgi:hypothetical protein